MVIKIELTSQNLKLQKIVNFQSSERNWETGEISPEMFLRPIYIECPGELRCEIGVVLVEIISRHALHNEKYCCIFVYTCHACPSSIWQWAAEHGWRLGRTLLDSPHSLPSQPRLAPPIISWMSYFGIVTSWYKNNIT